MPSDWEQMAEAASSALIGLVVAAFVFFLIVAAICRGGRDG